MTKTLDVPKAGVRSAAKEAASESYREHGGTVGKTTLSERAGGERAPGKRILSDDARATLRTLGEAALGRFHTAYEMSLVSLEIEKRVEKDDELGALASVLYLAGGKILEIGVGLMVRELRAAGAIEHALQGAGVRATEKEASGLAHELSERGIEAAIGISVDLAKEKAKAPIATAIDGDDKAVALGFIDRLKDGAMVMFDALARKLMELDDASLIAANEALKPENIMPSKVRAFLDEKLEAFLKTKIRTVGTRSGGKGGVLEHKVGWMYEPGAMGPRLIYVDEGFDAVPAGEPGAAYESVPKLSLGDTATWTGTVANTTNEKRHPEFLAHARASGVRFVGPVEPEFVDAAIEQHKATWQEAPKNYQQITSDGAPRLEPI